MKLFIPFFFFALSYNISHAQEYWVSAINSELYDDCQNSIRTSDGGVIAVGTKESSSTLAIKFDAKGVVEWTKSFAHTPAVLSSKGISVVEGDDGYFIGEASSLNSSFANILKIDFDGDFIERYTNSDQYINELMIDSEGMLVSINSEYPNANMLTMKKFDQAQNNIWELDLSFGLFSASETNAYIDDQDQVQLWIGSSTQADSLYHVIVDPNGNIISQISYPAFEETTKGILHGQFHDTKAVYMSAGGSINGTTRTLTLVDLNNQEQVLQKELSDPYFWFTDLDVFQDRVYILTQINDTDGQWTTLLILDENLDTLDEVLLKDLIPEGTNDLRGIIAKDLNIDESGNLLITGFLLGSVDGQGLPSAKGFLNMHLNSKGGLDDLSSTGFEDFAELSLFPNPCQDKFIIYSEFSNLVCIDLFDRSGKKLAHFKDIGFPYEVNTDMLKPGSYFIVISNGTKKMTRSFIKQ